MSGVLPYILVWSSIAKASLFKLKARWQGSDRENEFEQVIRTFNAQVRRTPLSVGSPYRFVGSVEERVANLEFVSIDFAVDIQRQLVLVRDCQPIDASNP